MKKILFILCAVFTFSCDDDNQLIVQNRVNKVLMLKVNFLTHEFEGGREFDFSASENFTITSIYNPPADFGDIQLYYSELDEKIFEGTIIWLGSGEISYPKEINGPESFTIIDENLKLPESSLFKTVMYNESAYYPKTIDYSSIWKSMGNLNIVKNYRISNPKGKINLFLYTPSVGVGNPAEWDWYIYIKN